MTDWDGRVRWFYPSGSSLIVKISIKNHYIITALLNKWVMRIRIRSHENVVDTLTTSLNYLLRKCIGTNENLNFDIRV